ncbi:DUF1707 SHOCT-like domain-containing protein [Nocardiopsis ansamitocini]|nr:DUF1707 domain-containing protein [Nocardiopsis ansamitocini]
MANTPEQSLSPHPGMMRASDSDRDTVARILTDALADGRINQDEHAERLETLYSAKTLGELGPLTSDLAPQSAVRPSPTTSPSPVLDSELAASSIGSENITAVFGAAERKGRWLVEPRTNVSAMFGGIELDLREAILAQHEVTIQCAVVFGGLEIIVPPGVRVVNEASAIFGGMDIKDKDSGGDAGSPVVRVTGLLVFGGIDVRTQAPGAKKSKKSC